jgi:hypothetical protein
MSAVGKPAASVASSTLPAKLRPALSALKLAEHVRREWDVKVPPEATQDDVRSPYFFSNIAPKLTRHDLITVRADDETWQLELVVERVLADEVYCTVLKAIKREGMGEGSTQLAPDFRTKRVGGKGWCVERISDGCLVIQGHALEANAIAQFRREQPRKVA